MTKRAAKKPLKNTVSVREVQELRAGNPDMETLVEFFERRERFFSNFKEIGDRLEFSPMYLIRAWENPEPNPQPFMTKQDRATAKGRAKEHRKRQQAKAKKNPDS
jgi:hypothetical protein